VTSNAQLIALVGKLPKTELHLHIEGSLEPGMVMEMAQRNDIALPFKSTEQLKALYNFKDLQSFLDLYYQATNVLQTEQDFFDLTWAYLQHCDDENIVHTEIFFDPQSHTERGIPFAVVIDGISAALAKARTKLKISSRLIMCFLRHLSAEDALATWHMAEPFLDRIDGVGLDSAERDFPPVLFEDVFRLAREAGLRTVAHAGEEGPPDYIRQAIDLLKVSRIDHGVRVTEDPELIERLAENQIPLTVCPLSNTRLCVYKSMKDHPIIELLEAGLMVTVNSDDPAYFGGYLEQNYAAVIEALSPSREQVIRLVRNGFSASFLEQTQKASWLAKIDSLAGAG
jgi:adenosine deaminase